MTFTFNLADQPWIPVVGPGGSPRNISLREALINAHQYQQLGASLPQTNAALYRLLLAVLHRCFGPADENAWNNLWQRKFFNAGVLEPYLQQWHNRFDLFADERPFFQNRHPKVEVKTANTLLFLAVGGNPETLFDHAVEDHPVSLAPARAALALVTDQSFGLAGICHPQLKLFYKDAPCSRAAVFLLQGKNLFESLMLNLVPYNSRQPLHWQNGLNDLPAWEMDNPLQPERTVPIGYLDYLTWQTRRILLIPEVEDGKIVVRKITTAPGLSLSEEQRNPMHHYRVDKQSGIKVLRFSEGRALWRYSSALLKPGNVNCIRPAALDWAEELKFKDILPGRKLTLAALGMATDPGKSKVLFYRAEQFEFDDRLLINPELTERLETALVTAEGARSQLWGAVNHMAGLILETEMDQEGKPKPNPDDVKKILSHWDAETLYWGLLEVPFYRFLDHLLDHPQEASDQWKIDLRKTALNAFEQTVVLAGTNVRALKASAKAQRQLYSGLKKALVIEQ
jgi:CRISPR system Cascade subunit CasA